MTRITDEKEGHHKLPRRLRVSRGITLFCPTGNTHPDATYRCKRMESVWFWKCEDRKGWICGSFKSSVVCIGAPNRIDDC